MRDKDKAMDKKALKPEEVGDIEVEAEELGKDDEGKMRILQWRCGSHLLST